MSFCILNNLTLWVFSFWSNEILPNSSLLMCSTSNNLLPRKLETQNKAIQGSERLSGWLDKEDIIIHVYKCVFFVKALRWWAHIHWQFFCPLISGWMVFINPSVVNTRKEEGANCYHCPRKKGKIKDRVETCLLAHSKMFVRRPSKHPLLKQERKF